MIARWRLVALRNSLWNAWPMGMALGGLAVALLVGWDLGIAFNSKVSETVLYAGMVLELLGVGLVIYDLSDTLKKFGRPSLGRKVGEWFRDFFAAFRPLRTVGATLNLRAESKVNFRGGATIQIGEDATPEARISLLEKNLKILRDEVNQKLQEMTNQLATTDSSVADLNRKIGEVVKTTDSRIEDLAIGSVHLEAIGLFWITIGVFATNIPEVIAGWFGLK